MSQIITLKRKISKDDLVAALDQIESLSLGEEQECGFTLDYVPDPNSLITFANGEVEATSPNDALLQDLETLAALLEAEVILEDEVTTPHSVTTVKTGWEVVLLWPILIVVLFALLVWRW